MAFNPSDSFRVLLVDPDGVAYSIGSGALGTFDPSNSARVVLVDIDGVPYKATGGGGGGTPGGAFNSVQFNNAGSFGGFGSWNGTTLQIPGAANSLNLAGSATGNPVTLTATGSDSVIDLQISPKGNGELLLGQEKYGAPDAITLISLANFTPIVATTTSKPYTGLGGYVSFQEGGTTNRFFGMDIASDFYGILTNLAVGGVFDTFIEDGSTISTPTNIAALRTHIQTIGSANVTLQNGLYASADNFGSGTVTENNGIVIGSASNNGTITTNTGLLIADQTAGATNYALKTGLGKVHLGGSVNLAVLTSNGFVKTGSGDGTLSVDTATYLTAAGAVTSIKKSGDTALVGAVTLSGGTNVTLTQSGQDISIAASGGAPGGSTTQLQYNNSSAFGGISGATTNGTSVTFGSGNLSATSPKITTQISDTNGNTVLGFLPTSSAVNYLTLDNQAAGDTLINLTATGTDWDSTTNKTQIRFRSGGSGSSSFPKIHITVRGIDYLVADSNAAFLNLNGPSFVNIGGSSGIYTRFGGNTRLYGEAADVLAQRNGTTAQTFRVYGTFTDTSNYERASLSAQQNASITLAAETAGTGGDNLSIFLVPAGTGRTKSATPLSMISTGGGAVTGNATLVGGTVTVSTTAALTGSSILLTRKTSGGTIGTAITYTISNGVSFTINSDNILDTSTFTWVIFDSY